MPFQPINFAGISPQQKPSIIDSLIEGFKAGFVPKQLMNQQKQQQLSNSLSENQLKYQEPLLQAQLQKSQREAALQKMLMEAMQHGLKGGTAGVMGEQPGGNDLSRALLNKALGLPANYESPEAKSFRNISQHTEEEKQKLNLKDVQELDKEIPLVEDRIKRIEQIEPLVKKHPEWFGAGLLGSQYFGPEFRKRNISNPEYGTLETGLAELVAPFAQELSSRGLASALNYALSVKPGFGEHSNITLGKLAQIKKSLSEAVKREKELYKNKGGTVNFEENTNKSKFNVADIEHTAQKYGITPEEVVRRLGG